MGGHGGKLRDDGNDEADGYDETLIPLDFNTAGQIRDDDLLKGLVKKFKSGVFVTSIMDCCHSGTVLDLPYKFKADGKIDAVGVNDDGKCCTISYEQIEGELRPQHL